MSNLSNSEVTPQVPHPAHRGPSMVSANCSVRLHRHRAPSKRPARDDVTALTDDLELVELRYEALRARMALEELFCEGIESPLA